MMHNQVLALQVAAAIFFVVCAGHLLRLVFRLKVTIGNFVVPLWLSFVGMMFSGLLVLWMISLIK
jgi:hypothetical protein